MSDNVALAVKNITKSFTGVTVLEDINIDFYKGEVHALLGENGAGKSTLIKIVSGYHNPDGGTIEVGGRKVTFKKPKDAIDASIHTIYQELTLCPLMSVAENIVMDKQDLFKGVLQDTAAYRRLAIQVLGELGQDDINPDQIVRELSIAQQQIVEIAKAISANARIILMDEPTSSISQTDVEKLMSIIKTLRGKGITIIYISHRLHEIGEIADRISVLRDGRLVATVKTAEVTDQDLIKMVVGRELTTVYPKNEVELGAVVLCVENLSSGETFRNVSFEVHRGEIFGIGGLVGSKRTEILEALFGMRPITSGKIYLNGQEFLPTNPQNAIRNKIAFITEDRKRSGIVSCLPVMENINMINAQKKSPFGYINWRDMRNKALRQQKALNIRLTNIDQPINTLSGGNQQKVVLGKWMEFEPQVILFDEPTRGIDVGAKTEIYTIMGELAAKGTAIIMISSELPELISVTDRIMVMREGEMKGILGRDEATQESVMSLAALQN